MWLKYSGPWGQCERRWDRKAGPDSEAWERRRVDPEAEMTTEGSPGGCEVREPWRGMGDPAVCHAVGVQEGGNREELVSTVQRLMGTPGRGTYLPDAKAEDLPE